MISHDEYSRQYTAEFGNGLAPMHNYERNVSSVQGRTIEDKLKLPSPYIGPNQMQFVDNRDFNDSAVSAHQDGSNFSNAKDIYLKLLNEGSRQSFREKQRLSEDLERQKRLLMEDLARNEKLRVEQIRRKQDVKTINWDSYSPNRREQASRCHQTPNIHYWSDNEKPQRVSSLYNNSNKPHSYGTTHQQTELIHRTYKGISDLQDTMYKRSEDISGQSTSIVKNTGCANHKTPSNGNNEDGYGFPPNGRAPLYTQAQGSGSNKVSPKMSSFPGVLSTITSGEHMNRHNERSDVMRDTEGKSAFRIVGNNPTLNRPGSLDLHRKMLQLDYKLKDCLKPPTPEDYKHCAHSDDDPHQKQVESETKEDSGSSRLQFIKETKLNDKINVSFDDDVFSRDNTRPGSSKVSLVNNSPCKSSVSDSLNGNEVLEINQSNKEDISDRNNNKTGDVKILDDVSGESTPIDIISQDNIGITIKEEKEGMYVTNDLVLDLPEGTSNKNDNYNCTDLSNENGFQSFNISSSSGGISELRITNVQSLRETKFTINQVQESKGSDSSFQDAVASSAISPPPTDGSVNVGDNKRKKGDLPFANEQDNMDSNPPGSKRKSKTRNHRKFEDKDSSPTDFMTSQQRVSIDLPNHNWLVERLLSENRIPADALKSPPPTLKDSVDNGKLKDSLDKEENLTEKAQNTLSPSPVGKDTEEISTKQNRSSRKSQNKIPEVSSEKGNYKEELTNKNQTSRYSPDLISIGNTVKETLSKEKSHIPEVSKSHNEEPHVQDEMKLIAQREKSNIYKDEIISSNSKRTNNADAPSEVPFASIANIESQRLLPSTDSVSTNSQGTNLCNSQNNRSEYEDFKKTSSYKNFAAKAQNKVAAVNANSPGKINVSFDQASEEKGYLTKEEDREYISIRKRDSTSSCPSESDRSIEPPPKLRRCTSAIFKSPGSNDLQFNNSKRDNHLLDRHGLSEKIKLDLKSEQDGLLKIDLSNDIKSNSSAPIDYASLSDYATRMVNAELKGKSEPILPPPGFGGNSPQSEARFKNPALSTRDLTIPSASSLSAIPRPSPKVSHPSEIVAARGGLVRPNSGHALEIPTSQNQQSQSVLSAQNMSRYFHHHHHHHVHQHHGTCNHLKQNTEKTPYPHFDVTCPHYGVSQCPDDPKLCKQSSPKIAASEQDMAIKERHMDTQNLRSVNYPPEKKIYHPDLVKDPLGDVTEIPKSSQNMPKRPVPTHPDFSRRLLPQEKPMQLQMSKNSAPYPGLISPHSTGVMCPSASTLGEELNYLRARRSIEIHREVARKEFSPLFNDHTNRRFASDTLSQRHPMSNMFPIQDKTNMFENREKMDFYSPKDNVPPFVHQSPQESNAIREANKVIREANAMKESTAMEEAAMLRQKMVALRQAEMLKEEAILRERAMQYKANDRAGVNSEEFERLRAFKQMKEHEMLLKSSERLASMNPRAPMPNVLNNRTLLSQNTLPGAMHRMDEANLRERMLRYNIEQAERLRLKTLGANNHVNLETIKMAQEIAQNRNSIHLTHHQEMINASRWNEARQAISDFPHRRISQEMVNDGQLLRMNQANKEDALRISRTPPLPSASIHFQKLSPKGSFTADPRSQFRTFSKEHSDHYDSALQSIDGKGQLKAEPLPHAIDLSKHPTLSKTLDQISKQSSYPAANGLMNLAMLARHGGNEQRQMQPTREKYATNLDKVYEKRENMSPRYVNGNSSLKREYPNDFSASPHVHPHYTQQRSKEGLAVVENKAGAPTDKSNLLSSVEKQRTPPGTRYFSGELFKILSEDRKSSSIMKKTEDKNSGINSPNVLPKMNNSENGEKETTIRLCKICNKDAQFLCSGCRGAWYCSHECQIKEWKEHSKVCKKPS